MLVLPYRTKQELRANIGKELRYQETGIFPEYQPDGRLTGVGPGAYERKWYATVELKDGIIKKVR